jgi:hypothetical protein
MAQRLDVLIDLPGNGAYPIFAQVEGKRARTGIVLATRSSLHRCLKRHGIGRLPEIAGEKAAKKPFKRYPVGYFHIDIAEVRTEEGKLYLSSQSIGRQNLPSPNCTRPPPSRPPPASWRPLIEAVPYKVHTVLTDNGVQLGDMPSRRAGPTARYRLHMFERICREHGIEHRLTKPSHPWTNGQVESGADEPHAQGGDGAALSLRYPSGPPRASRGFPERL